MASDNRFNDELVKGIWKENPVFVSALGLCPALAVTNSLINGIAMGAATFFVLFGSSLLVSTFRNIIPKPVRISLYILIIATFVTMVDFALAAVLPDIHKALGAFISLIVVNCLILGRQESFASKNSVGVSLADAIGMASGFTLALAMIGGVREILGNGSLLGFPLFGDGFEPWVIMILPPGGFFTMGTLIFLFSWFKERKEKKIEKKTTEQDNSFESWVV
ncbi:MAG: electron transport complex subunit RsxE [Acidobacteria bacterium]|nr:MAG: electron transport complex subunit RsxE [Acidobacteriota bacterium]